MWRPIWCSARLPSRSGPTADSIRPVGLIIPSRGRSHASGMTKAEWGSVLLFGRSCPPPPSPPLAAPPPRVDHAPGMILNGRGSFIPMRPGGGGLPVCWQCRSSRVHHIGRVAPAEQDLCLRLVFHDRRPACGRQRGLRRSVAASTARLLRFSGGRATACADDGTIFSGGDRRGGGGSGRSGGGRVAPGSDSAAVHAHQRAAYACCTACRSGCSRGRRRLGRAGLCRRCGGALPA